MLAYARGWCNNHTDAEDLTQGFFERLLAKRIDLSADPNRGRFRHYLRAAIANFVKNQFAVQHTQRRASPGFPLEDAAQRAEHGFQEPEDATSPELAFEQAWALTVLDRALCALAAEAKAAGKSTLFAELKEFLLEPAESSDYSALANRLQLRANTVAVSVHRLKTRMRELVQLEIAETVLDQDDVVSELRDLRRAGVSRKRQSS